MYAQWLEIVRPPRPTNLTAFTRIHIVYRDRAEPSSQLLSSLLTWTQKTSWRMPRSQPLRLMLPRHRGSRVKQKLQNGLRHQPCKCSFLPFSSLIYQMTISTAAAAIAYTLIPKLGAPPLSPLRRAKSTEPNISRANLECMQQAPKPALQSK